VNGDQPPSLAIRGLSASYGDVDVLRGVDLDVGPGELVALVGANGAGKSTLLKCISGLLRVRSGEIRLGAHRLDLLSSAAIVRLGVAHVPERRQIFAEQTVRDNLILGAYVPRAQLGQEGVNQRIEQACEMFPALRSRLDEPASNLSGGQQQMLAIARGLMLQPRLLLLDEPSLGLAPVLVQEIFRALANLRQTGAAILLVEQNARLSLAIGDRGYVLERGRVVMRGAGAELLASPDVLNLYLGGGGHQLQYSQDHIRQLGERFRSILGAHP
jgi:branched-chain amino acid transport system ATP-binding protein